MASRAARPLAFLYPSFAQASLGARSICGTAVRSAPPKGGGGVKAPRARAASPAFKQKAGSKEKRSSEGGLAGGKLNEEFFAMVPPLDYLPDFDADMITRERIGKAMAYPERSVHAFKTFGVPKSLERDFGAFSRPFSVVRETTLEMLDALDKASGQPTVSSVQKETMEPQETLDVLDETGDRPTASDVQNATFETSDASDSLDARPGRSDATSERDNALDEAERDSPPNDQSGRFVLTGVSGCGKSTLLMQAVNYCLSREWIVLYTPRVIDWVNSSTAYSYDTRSRTFLQPSLSRETLRHMLTVNGDALASIFPEQTTLIGQPDGQQLNLKQLVQMGIEDEANAPAHLEAVLRALGKQTQFPVLWAIDDFQALYSVSLYRDPEYKPISSYHLSMPRLALDYASGKKSFGRGAVVGALSTTDVRFPAPIDLLEGLGADLTSRQRAEGPYAKRSRTYQNFCRGLSAIHVPPRLNMPEAVGMFQVWLDGKVLHSAPNDELFLAKYTESSGNPREMGRALLGTML